MEESLIFYAWLLFFKYLWNEWASCPTYWSIMKQPALRIAFCSIGSRFRVSFLFMYIFFFLYLMRIIAAVVGDIGRNILSYEGYKWILVFAAAQSASFPIMNALLRNTYRGSLSFCMVEDCWTTFFCRACRKRQGTLGQVFPIAMSQILYQWHVS